MANFHVLQGGSDSNSGATWSAPKATVGGALSACARGDTIYVGDGDYGPVNFTKAGTTPVITVKKAIESDHGSSTGWLSSMGNGQAIFTNPGSAFAAWDISMSGLVVDGQTGGGPGNWKGETTPFGFKVVVVGANGKQWDTGGQSNITLRHFESTGDWVRPGSPPPDGGSFGGTDLTFSYFYIHEHANCGFRWKRGGTRYIAEYGFIGRYGGPRPDLDHAELITYDTDDGGTVGDAIFRYNIVNFNASTGGLMRTNESNQTSLFHVYGNVFYQDPALPWDSGGNGLIAVWFNPANTMKGLRVFYNTFVNSTDFVYYADPAASANKFGNNEARNNLFYNQSTASIDYQWIQTHSHSHYVDAGGTHSETGATSATGNPFVGTATSDYLFQLAAPTTAGFDVGNGGSAIWSGPGYDQDMLGNLRTSRTRGAFEFGSSGGSVPAAPTNLRFV